MLRKTDVLLRIEDPDPDSFFEPGSILITGWYNGTLNMIDDHLCEKFPDLENIDELYDLQEGALEYSGGLTKEELKNELASLGFQTMVV